jgi:hypothetical protein
VIVDRFLLAPHGPTTCVVLRYVDEDLHEHGPPLEVRGGWVGSIGEDSMQVVVIDDDGRRLRLFELGEDALHETKALPLPVGGSVRSSRAASLRSTGDLHELLGG